MSNWRDSLVPGHDEVVPMGTGKHLLTKTHKDLKMNLYPLLFTHSGD